jgi:hypothetical protein
MFKNDYREELTLSLPSVKLIGWAKGQHFFEAERVNQSLYGRYPTHP